MARDFNGTNENISFGSDASVDDFAPTGISISLWFQWDASGVVDIHVSKGGLATGWIFQTVAGNSLTFRHPWSSAVNVGWAGTTTFNGAAPRHICVTYDGSADTNDAVIYVNGVAESMSEVSGPPSGTIASEAANSLIIGENSAGGADFDGRICVLAVANEVFSAADVNRARWWGRAKGGLDVYHPLYTDKLANEGSATAAGSATGTTLVTMVCPVVRPGSAMMGMGVGW